MLATSYLSSTLRYKYCRSQAVSCTSSGWIDMGPTWQGHQHNIYLVHGYIPYFAWQRSFQCIKDAQKKMHSKKRSNSLGLLVQLGCNHCQPSTCYLSNGFSCRDLYGSTHLGVGFLLRCFQQFSTLHMATQRIPLVEELVDQRCILPGPLVLWKAPLNAPTPTPDMDQTVSRTIFTAFKNKVKNILSCPRGWTISSSP